MLLASARGILVALSMREQACKTATTRTDARRRRHGQIDACGDDRPARGLHARDAICQMRTPAASGAAATALGPSRRRDNGSRKDPRAVWKPRSRRGPAMVGWHHHHRHPRRSELFDFIAPTGWHLGCSSSSSFRVLTDASVERTADASLARSHARCCGPHCSFRMRLPHGPPSRPPASPAH